MLRPLSSLRAFLQPDGPDRWRFRNSLDPRRRVRGAGLQNPQPPPPGGRRDPRGDKHRLDADSPTLALHFWRAGDAVRTWQFAQEAGELARRAYANVDATARYDGALEVSRRVLGVTDEDRARLWSIVGKLRELTGMLDGCGDAIRRAALLTTDPVAKAEILTRRAAVHSRAGSPTTALRFIARARRVIEHDQGAGARSVAIAPPGSLDGGCRLGQEKPQEARKWAQRAAEAARANEDSVTLAKALMTIDNALQMLGTPDVGEHTREALGICIQNGDALRESVARANWALAFYAGRWMEAVDWFTTSSRVALEAGNAFGAAESDVSLVDILIHQGKLDQAEEVLRDASRVLRASGIEFYAAHAEMLQARILLANGALGAAEEGALRVVTQFNDLGSPVSALEASRFALTQSSAWGAPPRH